MRKSSQIWFEVQEVLFPYIEKEVVEPLTEKLKQLVTCLIMLDEDNVVKFAQDNKIQFSTYKDLTRDAQVVALIDEEVKKVNQTLSRQCRHQALIMQIKENEILIQHPKKNDPDLKTTPLRHDICLSV